MVAIVIIFELWILSTGETENSLITEYGITRDSILSYRSTGFFEGLARVQNQRFQATTSLGPVAADHASIRINGKNHASKIAMRWITMVLST
jgi:hypothetical protein